MKDPKKTNKNITNIEQKISSALDKLEAFSMRQRSKNKKSKGMVEYATFNDRVFASVIDTALSFIIVAPLLMGISQIIYQNQRGNPLAGLPSNAQPSQVIAHLVETNFLSHLMLDYTVHYVVFGIIVLWLWHVSSATPGKWFLRMRIVDAETFCKPTPAQLLKRYAGYIVSSLPLTLGFVWILFDKKNRAWHDMMSHTVVVKVKHWKFKDDGITPHVTVPKSQSEESGINKE